MKMNSGVELYSLVSPRSKWLILLLVVSMSACTLQRRNVAPVPVAQEVVRSSVKYQKEYLLVAGDQVEISVWRSPEVSRTVVVRPDGYISLPLIQDLPAAGRSPREVAESVRVALSERLLKPEVTVIPLAVRQPSVYVLGDVRSPGVYPIRNAVTAVQAIAVAGGSLRSASERDITIIRLSDEGYLEAINIGDAPSNGQMDPYMTLAAVPLKPDDVIFVPETGRSQISRLLTDALVPLQIYLNYKLIRAYDL